MTISDICSVGLSTPTVKTPIDRRMFIEPKTNALGDSRYIDPSTGDYKMSSNGKIAGLTGVQQQVYLSLTTQLGSSAVVNLGQSLNNIRVITPRYSQDIHNAVTQALSNLTTNNMIAVKDIAISKKNTAIEINVEWTDLTVSNTENRLLNYGANQVQISSNPSSAAYLGLSPGAIPYVEAWFRSDMGVVAQNNVVSSWFNQNGSQTGVYDTKRDAYQSVVAHQPAFSPSDASFNFLPSITFSGAQYLQTDQWVDGYIGDPMTFFVVMKWKDNLGTYIAFDGYNTDRYYFENALGTLTIHETVDATGSTAASGAQAYLVVVNGASSYYKQSSHTQTNFTGNPGTASPLGFTIGNHAGGANNYVTIAEIAAFDGELSSYYQDQLLCYASQRYGITIA